MKKHPRAHDFSSPSERSVLKYLPVIERLGIGGRSAKEFEEYGRLMAAKYLVSYSRSPHYKALLKAVLKAALALLPVQVRCRSQRVGWYQAVILKLLLSRGFKRDLQRVRVRVLGTI